MRQNKNGFTLVELLVVMTLIAILATLGTIYMFGNFANSRDSVRVTDLGNIERTLEIYMTDQGEYPDPDYATEISYLDIPVWRQGVFGTGAMKVMTVFGMTPIVDPNFSNPYTYSVANRGREYQIATVMEGEVDEEENLGDIIGLVAPQAHASIMRAYVVGDYNQFVVKASTGGLDYYIATPSIISTTTGSTDVMNIITGRHLVFHDFFNLPSSYEGFVATEGGFNFNVSDPLVFSGSEDELKTKNGLTSFSEKLSYIYATTPTESFDIFRLLLESDNKNTKLKEFLGKHFKLHFRSFYDCRDILDGGGGYLSGDYEIDPDGDGPLAKETVYCDMDTGGGGWTQRDIPGLSNSDFALGAGSTISGYNYGSRNVVVALGSENTPNDSGYVLHQSHSSGNSYYTLGFHDEAISINKLGIGDEIRMSLWLRDDTTPLPSCDTTECMDNPEPKYIFRNILYGEDGLNDFNGAVSLVDTMTTSDGKIWNQYLLRKKVTRPLIDFIWHIGRGYGSIKDIYFTGVKLDVFYGGYED